ncbi:MAG: hypothetical protein COW67_11495 [Flavobacteriales bacterium CG18_big_fil_WC_8_21_14_2_50_32_9]|nr:MAG: hypothetical protein COW67_11495 [Flavobacteriales bacterium CG18_big_fil_WC_8_21_14_2_50_32_9]
MKKIFTILAIAFSINAVAQIPTNGLVRHYTFSGNANENASSQHGTVLGATLTTDRFGNPNSAYFFDGIDDYIDLPLSGLTLNEYSYSLWVSASSFPPPNVSLFVFTIGTTRPGNSLGGDQAIIVNNSQANNGWGLMGYNNPNSAFLTFNETNINPLDWYHITVTRSNNVQKLYVNCNLVAVDSSSTNVTPYYGDIPTAKIGTRQTNTNFFHGNIDDVRIYNRALSITEIVALCEEGLVSIDEQPENQNIQIYPNPTNSTITINIEANTSVNGYKVEINNLLGQTVYVSTMNTTKKTIDLSTLENGVYFVKILDENNNVVDIQKVVYH